MKTSQFFDFVEETDVTDADDKGQREKIARFGLLSEIGSVFSALKKVMLRKDAGYLAQSITRGELKEEIGDALWYVGMCRNVLLGEEDLFELCLQDLNELHLGPSADPLRIEQLDKTKIADLEVLSLQFDECPSLDNFQSAAFCTRRTEKDELRDVCVAVLQQLTAQLVRLYLPTSETDNLNTQLDFKSDVEILKEIIWHLSALASLNSLLLSDILMSLQEKTDFRGDASKYVSWDADFKKQERFPDLFEIAFVPNPSDPLVSEMYWLRQDKHHTKLGASLMDNHPKGDGYRYHDAIHVAFAVHLGWSPNLRKFMGLKRKSDKAVDNQQDGGRAAILEEMIILQVHTYASKVQRFALEDGNTNESSATPVSPFEERSALTFEFVRSLRELSKDYEVYQTKESDWRNAIQEGYRMYVQLQEKGGVLIANTVERSVTHRPLTRDEIEATTGI